MAQYVDTKWGRFTSDHLKQIKEGHAAAIAADKDRFEIGDQMFLTKFAGYLIEFLEGEGLRAD